MTDARSFSVRPDQSIDVEFDVERRLAALRRDHSVKGMFTVPVVDKLVKQIGPAGLDRVKRSLHAPPKAAHVAFTSYPIADHQRLTIELVKKLHPDLPLSEGLRRFERSSAERFADSTLGKVLVAVLSDPRAALMKLPEINDMVSNTGRITATEEGDGVRLCYRDYSGFLDCAVVGSLEGVVLFFRKSPRIDVRVLGDRDADYLVRW